MKKKLIIFIGFIALAIILYIQNSARFWSIQEANQYASLRLAEYLEFNEIKPKKLKIDLKENFPRRKLQSFFSPISGDDVWVFIWSLETDNPNENASGGIIIASTSSAIIFTDSQNGLDLGTVEY